jgi:ribosomal protein S18 acetylase RimI-like enzyme
MLTVRPHLQNQGLGRRLMEAAEELSMTSGCDRLRLSVVDTRHELKAYYERRGFLDTGQRMPFPSSDPAYGLPRQPLHLLVMEKRLKKRRKASI